MVRNDKFPVMYHDLVNFNNRTVIGAFDIDGDVEFSMILRGQYKSAIIFRLSDTFERCLARNEFGLNLIYNTNNDTRFDILADVKYRIFSLVDIINNSTEYTSIKTLYKLRVVENNIFKAEFYRQYHALRNSKFNDFIPHKALDSALQFMDYYKLKSMRELEYGLNIVDELGRKGKLRYYDRE